MIDRCAHTRVCVCQTSCHVGRPKESKAMTYSFPPYTTEPDVPTSKHEGAAERSTGPFILSAAETQLIAFLHLPALHVDLGVADLFWALGVDDFPIVSRGFFCFICLRMRFPRTPVANTIPPCHRVDDSVPRVLLSHRHLAVYVASEDTKK